VYQDQQGTEERVQSEGVEITNVNDEPSGLLTILGAPSVGESLYLSNTIVDADGFEQEGESQFQYQWYRNGSEIDEATESDYTLTQEDMDAMISVSVRYLDGHGKEELVDGVDPVGPVIMDNGGPSGRLTLTGMSAAGLPKEDDTLTVDITGVTDRDGISDSGFRFKWYRDGVLIRNVYSDSYTLSDLDVNRYIKAVAHYTDSVGNSESISTVEYGPVINVNDSPTGLPLISGASDLKEGKMLTVYARSIKDSDGIGDLRYEWKRINPDSGRITSIVGANDQVYTLTQEDVNSKIMISVSYYDGHNHLERRDSVPTTSLVENVNDEATGDPMIVSDNDTLKKGMTLSVDVSAIQDEDGLGQFEYQWIRNKTLIAGATEATYQLGRDDVGASLKVMVVFEDQFGHIEKRISSGTNTIINLNSAPTGEVTIVGGNGDELRLQEG